MDFIKMKEYKRNEIVDLINEDPVQNYYGKYVKGYFKHDEQYYIFTNIGITAKTGHDYENERIGEYIKWYMRDNDNLESLTGKTLLSNEKDVHIFTRESENVELFVYNGLGKAIDSGITNGKSWILWKLL